MAKMHSRARGNAHSNKPLKPVLPVWIRHKPKEVEMLISKFSKEGKTASEIGIILRDSYGIPSVKLLTGKRMQELLAEKKLLGELPEDMVALMRRSVLVRKHLEANKHDMPALRGLQFTESKIKRLAKYYKKNGRLAADWKYDPANVKIYA
ncbi:30S ribosomal protein S15 [Candidatus Woesearchaeota archaeon]|nr:30S ribosomal protein S15 [Candidatus Woesearchaeota archaeon]